MRGKGDRRMPIRHILVDRPMQLRFGRLLALEVTVVSLVFGGLLFYILWDHMRVMESLAPPGVITAAQKALMLRPAIAIGVALLVNIILLIGLGIYVTHEVAGPAYRLGKYMKGVGAGQFSVEATLRARDQLKTMAASFNEMVKGLQEGLKEDMSRLEQACKRLEGLVHDPAKVSERGRQELVEVERSLKELVERKGESLKATG